LSRLDVLSLVNAYYAAAHSSNGVIGAEELKAFGIDVVVACEQDSMPWDYWSECRS
jgi:hypothetical protein